MLKKYIDYIQNNPEGYWFKRKLYGWGWVPVTWQGWLVIAGLVVVLVFAATHFLVEERVIEYFAVVAIAALCVIAIAYWKGESPRWQWGLPMDEAEKRSNDRSV